MSLLLLLSLTGLLAGLFGAFAASALWWWLAPRPFLERWSAHLRASLDAGFAEHGVAMRLQAQADRMWSLQQEHKWRAGQEVLNARHEACFLAELRLLMKRRGTDAETPDVSAATAEVGATLSDLQLDALEPELPAMGKPRKRVLPAPGSNPLRSL